jgi:hypothetical protein
VTCRVTLLTVIAVCIPVSSVLGRIWTDRTGKFKTEAEMVKVVDGKVHLKKADGKLMEVPFARLSKTDQEYVASQTSARAGDPKAVSPTGLKTRAKLEWDSMTFTETDGKKEPPALIVGIEFLGKPAAEASAYGFLKITKATDGQGNSLRLKKSQFSMDDPAKEFVKIDRSDEFFSKHPKGGVRVPVKFEQPTPVPKKLAIVEGSVKLRTGGQHETVTVTGLSTRPKPVKHEGLPDDTIMEVLLKEGNQVTLRVKGNDDVVVKVDLTDTKGRSLANGTSWTRGGNLSTFNVHLENEPPKDAQFKVALHLNAVEIEVPISLKNLKVPGLPEKGAGFDFNFD